MEKEKNNYTFELTSNGNILWQGNMMFQGIGAMLRNHKAYEAYCKDTEETDRLPFFDFNYQIYNCEGNDESHIYKKYGHIKGENERFITNLTTENFDLTLKEGMDMGIVSDEFKGMIIKGFETPIKMLDFKNYKYWDKTLMKTIIILCEKKTEQNS